MHAPESERDELYVDQSYDMIVVSNRLPVDYQVGADGERCDWKSSPGGLVTALEPVMRAADGAWVGWAGVADLEFDPFEHDGISIIPVPLSADELEDYYEGFSNDTLWPLYHDVIAPPAFHREWWDAYVASTALRRARPRVRAPTAPSCGCRTTSCSSCRAMLRESRPDLVDRVLQPHPVPGRTASSRSCRGARQIIEGLLGADVIGFQRVADAGNFSRAVRRLFGYTTRGTGHRGARRPTATTRRVDRAGTSRSRSTPPGSRSSPAGPRCRRAPARSATSLGNPETIMLGVDRLDYTKGIGHRLKAFGELLARRPAQGRGRHPRAGREPEPRARRDLPAAARRDRAARSAASTATTRTISHQAISYLHHGYPREEMVALYLAADVMLVTALRDGMNLVAKEYVACAVRRRRRAAAQRVHRRIRRAARRRCSSTRTTSTG